MEAGLSDIGFDTEEAFDLTLIDVLILQQLRKFDNYILRFNVLEDINMQLPESKKLTSTKFYYRLERLEKLGLIEVEDGQKKKSKLIRKAECADAVLDSLLRSLIVSKIDFYGLFEKMLGHIVDRFSLSIPLGDVLVIIPEYEKVLDHRKISVIDEYASSIHLLASDSQFEYFRRWNRDSGYSHVMVSNSRIDKGDGSFDLVICLNDVFPDFTELIRVTKPGGLILVGTLDEVECSEHVILGPLCEQINQIHLIRGGVDLSDLSLPVTSQGQISLFGTTLLYLMK